MKDMPCNRRSYEISLKCAALCLECVKLTRHPGCHMVNSFPHNTCMFNHHPLVEQLFERTFMSSLVVLHINSFPGSNGKNTKRRLVRDNRGKWGTRKNMRNTLPRYCYSGVMTHSWNKSTKEDKNNATPQPDPPQVRKNSRVGNFSIANFLHSAVITIIPRKFII